MKNKETINNYLSENNQEELQSFWNELLKIKLEKTEEEKADDRRCIRDLLVLGRCYKTFKK